MAAKKSSRSGAGSSIIPTAFYEENLAAWDERAPAHARADGYQYERFASDPGYLSDVVRFDMPLLGDLNGVRGVHLQCHIGTDTISLARLGARMTGLDFSGESLEQARRLSKTAGPDVDYVQSDVYAAREVLGTGEFDLVFTGIGALCWLPDVRLWAQIVHDLLAPGGVLHIREGHPMLWAIDESMDGALVVDYPYFETAKPVTDEHDGSYLPVDTTFAASRSHSWNHGLAETVTAVMDAGLVLEVLQEHDSCPWEALPGKMIEDERGEWLLTERRERLPLTYTLRARRVD